MNIIYYNKFFIFFTVISPYFTFTNTFTNCYHLYGTVNSQYNPEGLKDGRIYVPDDKVEELKVAEKWNVFADIIKPLSEYVEEVDLKNISGYEDEQGNITTNELTYEEIN